MDGITDKRKNGQVQRLLNVASSVGGKLQLQNLNSKIEEYIAPVRENRAENFLSADNGADDEDCDEVPNNNTIVLHGLPIP